MIDIQPKPLETQPVETAKEIVAKVIAKLDGVKVEVPQAKFNWSDAGNLIKQMIVDLTLMVYNGKLGIKFWAVIIVVVLYLLFKVFNIF